VMRDEQPTQWRSRQCRSRYCSYELMLEPIAMCLVDGIRMNGAWLYVHNEERCDTDECASQRE